MGVEINKNNNRPFSAFFEVVRLRRVRGCAVVCGQKISATIHLIVTLT